MFIAFFYPTKQQFLNKKNFYMFGWILVSFYQLKLYSLKSYVCLSEKNDFTSFKTCLFDIIFFHTALPFHRSNFNFFLKYTTPRCDNPLEQTIVICFRKRKQKKQWQKRKLIFSLLCTRPLRRTPAEYLQLKWDFCSTTST